MLIRMICAALALTCLAACKDKEKEAREAAIVEIMHGNTPNAELAAAMEKAKASREEFMAVLKNPGPGQAQFLVKKVFPAAGGKQQILWINQVTFDGKLIHGRADDRTVKPGNGIPNDGTVAFPPEDIVDWMYNDNGKAVGGWTLRAYKKLFPEEWAAKGYGEKIQFKE